MRIRPAAAALGLLVLTYDGTSAQTPERPPPVTAAAPATEPPDIDLKAMIAATEKARDELRQRFEAESAKKGSKDAKRDAELHSLSNSVCAGCGGAAPSSAPVKRSPPKRAAPKRKAAEPGEPPIVDDLH